MEIKGDVGQVARSVDNGSTIINVAEGGIGQAFFSPQSTVGHPPTTARWVSPRPETLLDNTNEELRAEDQHCVRALWTLRKRLVFSVPVAWFFLGTIATIWCSLNMIQTGLFQDSPWIQYTWLALLMTSPSLFWLQRHRERIGRQIYHYRVRRNTIQSILQDRALR